MVVTARRSAQVSASAGLGATPIKAGDRRMTGFYIIMAGAALGLLWNISRRLDELVTLARALSEQFRLEVTGVA